MFWLPPLLLQLHRHHTAAPKLNLFFFHRLANLVLQTLKYTVDIKSWMGLKLITSQDWCFRMLLRNRQVSSSSCCLAWLWGWMKLSWTKTNYVSMPQINCSLDLCRSLVHHRCEDKNVVHKRMLNSYNIFCGMGVVDILSKLKEDQMNTNFTASPRITLLAVLLTV